MKTNRRTKSDGFTMVELLVVLAIIVLLLAIALPMMTPPLESRRLREASRGLAATLASARDRAISTGRPYGVRLERTIDLNGLNSVEQVNAVQRVTYVRVPPPYAGDFMAAYGGSTESRIVIRNNVVQGAGAMDKNWVITAPDAWANRIRYGDQIKLNYTGHLYTIGGGTFGQVVNNSAGCVLQSPTMPYPVYTIPQNNPAAGVPYIVYRQPQAGQGSGFELPQSIVVDLSASGMLGNEFDTGVVNSNGQVVDGQGNERGGNRNAGDVIILFGPQGGVDRVYYGVGGSATMTAGYRPTSPIYLLIGKLENVHLDSNGNSVPDNADDLKNLWVSINPQTGLIQSNEIYFNPGGHNLYWSRKFARAHQAMGGR